MKRLNDKIQKEGKTMKNQFKIMLTVLLCLCLSSTAFAAPLDSYTIDDVSETVTIYGSVEGAEYLDPIAIEVLNAGVEIGEDDVIDTEAAKQKFIYVTQLLADREGGYSLTLAMAGKDAAFYSVRVNGELGDKKFFFATIATKETELGAIKRICNAPDNAATITRLVNKLDSKNPDSVIINMFGVAEPLVSQVDAQDLAKTFYGLAKADANITTTPAGFKQGVETATHLVAMNEGKGDAGQYAAEIGVSEEIQKIYTEELSMEAKASFIEDYFKGKELFTLASAKDAFEEGIVLAYAESIDALADVTKIIETFGEEIGVDMSDYKKLKSDEKQELAEYISTKSGLDTIEDLKKAINDEMDEIIDDRSSGSSGGSGGGGGGGSSFVPSAGTGFSPVVDPATLNGFTDMAGNEWAVEAVNNLNEKGIVSGVGDHMFAPGRSITREEMLTMLLRAYGVDVTGASTDKFTDVETGSWYAPYVAKGLQLGVTEGISATEFGTGKYITRQEAAAMASRIAKKFGKTFSTESEAFADDAEIASWAKTAVYELKNAGVIGGVGDNMFAPLGTCTRAQAAQIIYQLIK